MLLCYILDVYIYIDIYFYILIDGWLLHVQRQIFHVYSGQFQQKLKIQKG